MHRSRTAPVPATRARIARCATMALVAGGLILVVPATAAASLAAVIAAGDIVVARDDGSASRVLVAHAAQPHAGDAFAAMSPNGRRVAVMTTQVRSAIYPIAGGKPVVTSQQLVGCRWAPSSALLVCQNSSPFSLTVVNAATGAVKRLAAGRFFDGVSFSPDSRRVAVVTFADRARLEVITLATRKVRVLRTGTFFSPAWGPTRIAFAIGRRPGPLETSDIYSVKPDGTGLRRLTRFKPENDITGLFPVAWSRNGRRILAGTFSPDFEADLDSWAVDPIHRRWHHIGGLSPTALSRDGRFVIGQTGDAEKTGIDFSDVVRTTWAAHGRRTVLIHHAWDASWTR